MTPHPPMPPLCDWIRSDKGEPSFLVSLPLHSALLNGVDWVKWSAMSHDFKPYALARVRAAWYDGGFTDLAAQWDKWAQDNQ